MPGAIVVNAKRLLEFARGIAADKNDILTFELQGSELLIAVGASQVRLLTMGADDFPAVKRHDDAVKFLLRADRLRNLIRRTIFAIAKDDSRPIFAGVNFEIKDDRLTLVGTNTHRIAIAHENLFSHCGDSNFIVPGAALAALFARLPDSDSESIEFNFADRFLGVTFENFSVTVRLIDGQFPPYERVIPKETPLHVTADTKEFLDALNFIKLMSKETKYNTVRLVIGDGNIEASASSTEVGDAVKKIPAAIEGESLDVSFNIDYLIDVLKVIATPTFNAAFNDRYSPAVFTEPDNADYIYVATPLRT